MNIAWKGKEILSINFRSITSSLSNPAEWFTDWLTGGASSSGISVNEKTSIQLASVYRCNKIISDTIASLPLKLYTVDEKGNKVEDKTHPISRILQEPNERQTKGVFWQVTQTHFDLWGNGYSLINRNNLGDIISLDLLHPKDVDVQVIKGEVVYFVTNVKGGVNVYFDYEILHFKNYSEDGIVGKSFLSIAKEAIGSGLASQEYGNTFFGNGANPSLAITQQSKPDQTVIDAYKRQFKERHQGIKNAHNPLLLYGGAIATPISLPLKDSQFIEVRKHSAVEVCTFFGVDPSLIGMGEHSTFNNREQANIAFTQYTINPITRAIEQELKKKLLKQSEKYGKTPLTIEFNIKGLLRGDIESQGDYYVKALQNGWMTINEVRKSENLPTVDGGDEIMVQANNMNTLENVIKGDGADGKGN